MKRRQRGLTLIEILIAMSIMAILSVLGYKAFSNLLIARESLMETSRRWVDLARAFRRVETDLSRLPTEAWLEEARRQGRFAVPLRLSGSEGDASLDLEVYSGLTPQGRERLSYRSGAAGLTWQGQRLGASVASRPYRLFPPGYRVSWRVMSPDGGFVGAWPRDGDSAGSPRALEMRVVMPDGTAVTRLWNLP
ncbi:PulJ/GspJ family protein [Paludibacterium paludis]|uniref:Type II secretion system protein J n=1 Tax=Paludibacterium paludis TaxID=1225769 RepID=A0A918U7P2_9NEIS|nr:prepilin-type N-terminal cleavage/methylation domain-containing protein [Paludibacterium paludis]GGY08108.1 hypothetical protein GCM10011289_08420 [Paludibacterium paludis]